jgi:hypothetical protein
VREGKITALFGKETIVKQPRVISAVGLLFSMFVTVAQANAYCGDVAVPASVETLSCLLEEGRERCAFPDLSISDCRHDNQIAIDIGLLDSYAIPWVEQSRLCVVIGYYPPTSSYRIVSVCELR